MEPAPPLLPIIFSLLSFILIIIFSFRFYWKKRSSASSSTPPPIYSKREEIQRVDAGAVILPEGSKKYSVHWQKYKDANALLDAEKMNDAIVIYKSLASIPEEAESALVGLGTCYSLKGDQVTAIECYQKAIQLNATNFNAFLGMGTANYKAAHYPTAVVYYKKANALDPKIPDSYWGLAAAYHMMKEKQLASENAKIFISMAPESRYRKYMEEMIIS